LFVNEIASLSPSERFNSVIEGLFSDVQSRLANGWFPEALAERLTIILIWRRLRRMSRRFAAIMARYRAGTLPEAGAEAGSGPARTAAVRPAGAPRVREPSRRLGWVIHAVSWFVWGRHYQMEEMLEVPETAEMVADAPEFGSVLRPMCRMLAVKQPAWLRLPRRPRKPRKRVKKMFPPAPEWVVNRPGAIFKPDGSVWERFGASAMFGKGSWRSLEQAQKHDPPQRIWPPVH